MKYLLTILLFVSGAAYAQHVPIISQYMFNDIALNPANTGNQNSLSIFGSYRAQWVGIPGAPKTQSFSAHSPLRNASSSVGIQFFADQIGVDKSTGIFGSYAYRIKMKKVNLSFGLAGGLFLVRSNNSQLAANDSGDELLVDSPLGIMPDVSFGMNLNAKKYFVSFSIPLFLGHTFDGNKIRVNHDIKNYNFMLGGGTSFKVNRRFKIKPSLLLKYKVGARPQLDLNAMIELHELFETGLSYRTEEAIIALFKFSPTRQFSVMYSFGMPITAISYKQFGSHELGLRFNFLYKTELSNARYLGW
ncbi:MAG: type IX secretion system membrane protein PorP/SprF [Crocinitomicaceae bacterium]|nr:type IX secretion system membrane protein PorP/SprF [Crocinitomicaceae bacterium]